MLSVEEKRERQRLATAKYKLSHVAELKIRRMSRSDLERAKEKATKAIWYIKNKDKEKEREKIRKSMHPDRVKSQKEKYRRSHRSELFAKTWAREMSRLGITIDDWHRMMIDQSGLCDMCGEPFDNIKKLEPVVDHDHTSNRVRSLIHRQCNTAIGILGDSISMILKALEYLIKHMEREIDEETTQDQDIHNGSRTVLSEVNNKKEGENIPIRNSNGSGEAMPSEENRAMVPEIEL